MRTKLNKDNINSRVESDSYRDYDNLDDVEDMNVYLMLSKNKDKTLQI